MAEISRDVRTPAAITVSIPILPEIPVLLAEATVEVTDSSYV